MSDLFRQSDETACMDWVSGAMTVFFLAVFVGWTVGAYWPGNKAAMDAAARMPLDDGGEA